MPPICRLCLKTNLETYNNIDVDDTRIKILSIIPDINIDIVDRPVICSDCYNVLTTAYSFKQNCLKIEERINMYTGNVVSKIILEKFLDLYNHRENKEEVKEEKPNEILYELDCEALLDDVSNETNTVDVETIKIEENPRKTTVEKTVCKFCNKRITPTGKQWIYHIGKHIKTKYICFICCEGFNTKWEYVTHKTEKHGRLPGTTKCHICSKAFSSTANMKKHLHIHKKKIVPAFQCDVCGLKVKQYGKLQTHLRTHNGERPFKCKFCEKAFAQSSTLSNHVKAVHMTERPYICEFCGKTFATNSDCSSHVKVHKDIEKNYVCSICGKAYEVANELNLHMKRHNGVKDYICEICSKGFVNRHGLNKHMRRHNEDKQFECHLCHKRFTTSSNRKVHLQSCMQRNSGLEVDLTTADK